FFFQAEDGIRDFHVTGVQTCALPIYDQVAARAANRFFADQGVRGSVDGVRGDRVAGDQVAGGSELQVDTRVGTGCTDSPDAEDRSEERRVGKEGRSGRWRDQ